METPGSDRLLIASIWVAVLGHIALLLSLDVIPFGDAPAHLARAAAIGDLWLGGGARYGDIFTFAPRFVPYILGDIILAVLTRLMPVDVAGRLWMVLLFTSLPVAVGAYLKAFGYSRPQVLVGLGMAIFLSVDWFFVNGFTAYRLGVALTLAGLVAGKRYVDQPGRLRLLAVWASALAAYLTHLSAHVFLGLVMAVFALGWSWRGTVRLRHVLALAAPLVLLTLWHLFFGGTELEGERFWGTLPSKILRLGVPFVRLGSADLVLLTLFAYSLLRLLARARLRDPQVADPMVAGAVFVATYFVLPISSSGAGYDIDARAIPLAVLFFTFAALRSFPGTPAIGRQVVILLIGVLGLNLAYLARELVPANAALREYRRVVGSLPQGVPFLYVLARPPLGRTQPFMDAHAWATIDRQAFAPYLYSARRGDAMPYFDFRRELYEPRGLYEPSEFWYLRRDMVPDWPRVVRDYRYLLIAGPFEPSRLGVTGRWVVRTEAASLLEISSLAAPP